jgi:hypothetical protein
MIFRSFIKVLLYIPIEAEIGRLLYVKADMRFCAPKWLARKYPGYLCYHGYYDYLG